MGRRNLRSRIATALAVALVMSVVVLPPSSAVAAPTTFTGGPDQVPIYLMNDHTPIAIHFTAAGGGVLATSTAYYCKVRFTVGTTPSGTTNRGFTWNPTTGRWAQERDPWTDFPQVTTDASGAISSNAGWVFAKFGDDRIAGADYHVMISLSQTGASATYNASSLPTVTVLDGATTASWVHDGIATGIAASKMGRATDAASSTILALQKTEANLVDDDSDGIVDNEDYGPAGATGDFRFGVPANTGLGIRLNQNVWAPGTGFVSGPADVDLAIGASDTSAPSPVSSLTATSGDGTASLSWSAATDSGGSGVAAYFVYRWDTAATTLYATAVRQRVATLSPSATSFDDTGLVNGVTYDYEVRAVDASTNVGPRSALVSATPALAAPAIALDPTGPDGDNGWYVTTPTATITPHTLGRTSEYSLDTTTSTWTTYTAPFALPEGIHTVYARDVDTSGAPSPIVSADFQVDTGVPAATPAVPTFASAVSANTQFPVSWTATSTASGLDGYDVDYHVGAAGSWTPWRSSTLATSAPFLGTQGQTVYFRTRATNNAGTVGPWSGASSTIVPFDDAKATYSSKWSKYSSSSRYLGSVHYTSTRNASASFTMGAGRLYVLATKGPKLGIFRVYVNGKLVKTYDSRASATAYRQPFVLGNFTASKNTVKIVNLATSGRAKIEIDGFARLW
jgi:hypothetical protein